MPPLFFGLGHLCLSPYTSLGELSIRPIDSMARPT
jgi:hypothetical protein